MKRFFKITFTAASSGLLVLALALATRAAQHDIPGPLGSVAFGTTLTVLPNGNIVVIDPNASLPVSNAGAVHLYSLTGVLISTLTGVILASHGVLGTVPAGGGGMVFAYDAVRGQLVVVNTVSDLLSLFTLGPDVSGDRLLITSVRRHAAGFTLTWRSRPGTAYSVEFTEKLVLGRWLVLEDGIEATGDATSYTDSRIGHLSLFQGFYKVREN